MSAEELAAHVCQTLGDAGITVTLTGGACVAIWSDGAYTSRDLDFVERRWIWPISSAGRSKRAGMTPSRSSFR